MNGEVAMKFVSDTRQLLAEIEKAAKAEGKLEKATTDVTKAIRAREKAQQSMARDAKRIAREVETPLESYKRRLKEIDNLRKAGKITDEQHRRAAVKAWRDTALATEAARRKQLQYTQAVSRTKTELVATGIAGTRAMRSVTMLAGTAGLGSISGAVMTIVQSYDKWVQKTREISDETKRAANEIVAFAALQEGGTKGDRVQRASMMAAKYGITDRGEAFNTVQAMQSVYGDFEKGLKASEAIFAGKQLGIDVAKGREIEVFGAMQGQKPGDYLRRAYVAGEQSGRTPETVVGGAEGFKNWDDKDFAFAAAAVLSGNIKEDKLGVYLKRSGMALSTAGASQEYFESVGMGKSSRAERLEYLAKKGMSDQVKLTGIGIKEVREREAISDLVRNYAEIKRVEKEIEKNAKPGLLVKERREVEAELPMMALERASTEQQARYMHEMAFGKQAVPALIEEIKQRARGRVYSERGMKSFLGFDLVDEEGRSGSFAQFGAGMYAEFGGGDLGSEEEWGRIRRRNSTEIGPDMSRPRYLALEIQRQQYLDLLSARRTMKLGGDGTAAVERALGPLRESLEQWSRWAEIQQEAAEIMKEAADKQAETANRQSGPPDPAVSHGDAQ